MKPTLKIISTTIKGKRLTVIVERNGERHRLTTGRYEGQAFCVVAGPVENHVYAKDCYMYEDTATAFLSKHLYGDVKRPTHEQADMAALDVLHMKPIQDCMNGLITGVTH